MFAPTRRVWLVMLVMQTFFCLSKQILINIKNEKLHKTIKKNQFHMHWFYLAKMSLSDSTNASKFQFAIAPMHIYSASLILYIIYLFINKVQKKTYQPFLLLGIRRGTKKEKSFLFMRILLL